MDYKHHLLNGKWVIEDVYKGMHNGFFLEAGATNGINGSGTVVLERDYGWTGICVEAIEHQYRRILQNRKCKADNRALSSESGKIVEFTHLPTRSGRSGLSTTLRKSAKAIDAESIRIQKQTVSLFDLLKEHEAPEIIHYFCFDVEGAELDILKAFPFNAPYKILAISIEGPRCSELMSANGYREVRNRFCAKTFERYFLHPCFDQLGRTVAGSIGGPQKWP